MEGWPMERERRWEYCFLACTPMTGLDEEGIRLSYQVAMAGHVRHHQAHSEDPSPLAAIALVLDQLGEEGWELVAFDTTTNRGVLKRPKT
jgi:hypothetical protein